MTTSLLNLSEIFSNIDWIQIAAGSLIPIIGYFIRIISTSIKNRKVKRSIMGKWYSYHMSRINYNSELRKEEWIIDTKYFGKGITIQVEEENSIRKELKYNGTIEFDDNYVTFNLEGKEHSEITQSRLIKPIPNEDTLMLGFHLAQDFSHEIYATTKLVCRNPRSDDEAVKILKESTKWVEGELCLRLTKVPIIPIGRIHKQKPAEETHEQQ